MNGIHPTMIEYRVAQRCDKSLIWADLDGQERKPCASRSDEAEARMLREAKRGARLVTPGAVRVRCERRARTGWYGPEILGV